MDEFTRDCIKAVDPYVRGSAASCSFCDHLDPLILFDGRHTYVTIAIGQMMEGYVQICTHKHRTSFTGMMPREYSEFCEVRSAVRNAFLRAYGTHGIAFEHGQAGSCMWRADASKNLQSLCHHAHVHLVPRDINIRGRVSEYIQEEIAVGSIGDLFEVRQKRLKGGGYLYFEDSTGRGYVYPAEGIRIPRQFLRTCVAKELGMASSADWSRHPGFEFFSKTRDTLMPLLQRELGPSRTRVKPPDPGRP